MDVVVEEIPEEGDKARRLRRVVVAAEHRRQDRIGVERRPEPRERVRMHDDVRVHEHENVPGRLRGAPVSCLGRGSPVGLLDEDDLLGRIVGPVDCSRATRQGGRPVGRRDDRG